MKKNNKNSDKKQILSEWRWIYANFPKFDLINDAKMPSDHSATLGHKFDHFKRKNYKSAYNTALEDESYSIYLNDDSIIYFYYIFDVNEKVVGHNLAYVPPPNNYNFLDEEISISKYLRVDYDKTGYKSIIHTLVHLHIGIDNPEFRIPISHYLSPFDFLYIILKYMYHNEQDIVDKLVTKKQKDCLLTNEESDKLRIIFGN